MLSHLKSQIVNGVTRGTTNCEYCYVSGHKLQIESSMNREILISITCGITNCEPCDALGHNCDPCDTQNQTLQNLLQMKSQHENLLKYPTFTITICESHITLGTSSTVS